MGRGSDNDIVIESGSVSGKHAEMHRVEGGYVLEDLGSTNGIKVDGMRQKKATLQSGMTLKLGDVVLDFSLSNEESEILGLETPEVESPIVPELPKITETEHTPETPAEEAPKKAKSKARQSTPATSAPATQPGVVGAVIAGLFLVLATTAFVTGLAIRHQKDTGETLIKAIVNKGDLEKKTPAVDEAAAQEEPLD